LIKVTSSPEETKALGQKIGKKLSPGDVVALLGELGSGKTCLVQGICQGLQIDDFATSPSFVIINEYKGKYPVYHFDLYRLQKEEELINLGYEEYFYSQGVCLIEWAEKAKNLLPEKRIEIELKIVSENQREIKIKGIKID
jgi:tRNA threonylcarbamoyladenosine biosynthesis protein TsaE